ncbi:MAG: NADPH-dependent glutamate synthase [Peptococcaceae bacterium]|nr:NADPH-dependent glutamate synthase [Peptococcaceae bacterium]
MSQQVGSRVAMPAQDPLVRNKNFNEVALGYTEAMALEEASRCLICPKPQCVKGCPVEVDIPGFIAKIKEKDFAAAAKSLKGKNSLPAICGRVCPQESQCESKCVRGIKTQPVAIGRLERFVADWDMARGMEMPETTAAKGKKVAIVGAGPAGLTCAGDLAKMGYEVKIFESLHVAGGVLMYGIPEFRLPKAVVQKEIDYIKALGVDIETNVVCGKTLLVDEILEEYDAVFIGTGAGLPFFMDIPGENLSGVFSANEFLTRSNLMKAYSFPEALTPTRVGKRVAVIGGGNVAMDAARTALRLGAEESWIVYRRSAEEMPARAEEVEHAREEGVIFKLLHSPIEFKGDENMNLNSMVLQKFELGEPDASGRRKPVPIPGALEEAAVDTVVIAIGQGPNNLVTGTTPGLILTKKGGIQADEATGETSRKGVYAGGDIVTGAATVILAMGAGKSAAKAIDEYLSAK